MKKVIVIFTGFLLGLTILVANPASHILRAQENEDMTAEGVRSDGSVVINEANFPDEVFRSYVSDQDSNDDGILTKEEIGKIKILDMPGVNALHPLAQIESMKGIEYLYALEDLTCHHQYDLASLDLSNNTALKTLSCSYCKLTSLNLGNNSALEEVRCHDNELTTLNISKNTKLRSLDCSKNKISRLDISNCKRLIDVFVSGKCSSSGYGNQKIVDFSDYDYDKDISFSLCYDVSAKLIHPELNSLVSVDENHFPDSLFCSAVSYSCDMNQDGFLSKGEIDAVTSLEVNCFEGDPESGGNIRSVKGIELFSNLEQFECSDNLLTSIDVSKNLKLKKLVCSVNKITSINVSRNVELTYLDCYSNRLKTLNISQNEKLETLKCEFNQIAYLSIGKCPKLQSIVRNNEREEVLGGEVYRHGNWDGLSYDKSTNLLYLSSPTGVKAASASYNSVKFSWNSVNDAGGYSVWRSSSADGLFTSIGTQKATSKVSGPLTTGTTYYYKVRAYKDINGVRYYSAFSKVVGAAPKVSAPTLSSVKPIAPTKVQVYWTAPAGVDYVQVWRTNKANAEQKDYVLLGTYKASAKTSVSKFLTPNTTYYYKIRGYRKLSNGKRVFSGYSKVVSAKPTVSIATPQGLKVTATTTNSISLTWNKVSGSSIMYEVWRLTSKTNTPGVCLGRYSSPSKISTHLDSGRTYYYRVRAYYYYYDGNGKVHRVYGAYSTIVSGKTK